jgi:peptidoglycan/xylan/chitin deacetylase (PgdA/CDA1 family)
MKSVMYHYVRPFSVDLPHFPFLALRDFERQIDYFASTYGLVQRDEFVAWKIGGQVPKGVLLTFDDGLLDHYAYVYDVLRRRGAFGIFYIPSLPMMTGTFLPVHKLHLILGRLGGEAVLSRLLETKSISSLCELSDGVDRYKDQTSSQATKQVKYFFNWKLSAEKLLVLNELYEYAFAGRPPSWEHFYLNEKQLLEMHAGGMGIGAHGYEHLLLSNLDVAAQRNEILASCKHVLSMVGSLEFGYCYAYGSKGSFNSDSQNILRDAGCPFAFAVKDGDIERCFLESEAFDLPRYDCNVFPHGTARYLSRTV